MALPRNGMGKEQRKALRGDYAAFWLDRMRGAQGGALTRPFVVSPD